MTAYKELATEKGQGAREREKTLAESENKTGPPLLAPLQLHGHTIQLLCSAYTQKQSERPLIDSTSGGPLRDDLYHLEK